MKEEKCEKEFFIKAAKALGWYKIETKTTLSIIGQYVKLSESAVSKYLIAPQKADDLEAEIFAGKRKIYLTLKYALQIAEAMGSTLWEILYLYDEQKNKSANCTKMNSNQELNLLEEYGINFLADANDVKYKPWIGNFYCYFSSTSSNEINKEKREKPKKLTSEEQELYDITPSKDHLFCGIMSISKADDNSCQVLLRFMSDKWKHNIKHYYGKLVLSRQYSAGFISLFCEENGECSYLILESPDSQMLRCRMAMVLTLSSIDRHRRACVEKMLISKNIIKENSKAYDALKAFLPMNDSIIRITSEGYKKLRAELLNSDQLELQQFVKKYSELEDIINANSTIEAYECAMIPESTIDNWKLLSPTARETLCILMRKYSITNWYHKANNKNAEKIFYLLKDELTNKTENSKNSE